MADEDEVVWSPAPIEEKGRIFTALSKTPWVMLKARGEITDDEEPERPNVVRITFTHEETGEKQDELWGREPVEAALREVFGEEQKAFAGAQMELTVYHVGSSVIMNWRYVGPSDASPYREEVLQYWANE